MTDELSVVSQVTAELARLREMMRQTQEALARKKGVHRCPDGTVSVTVDGNGRVLALDITQGAIRGHGPQVLAKTIMEAINTAKSRAMRRSNQIMSDILEAWDRGQ